MGSKPITERAGTNYGSAPVNQEVTVDAKGTKPAEFPRMSPVKQTITDLVDSGDWSPNYITVGGERNVTPDPGLTPTGIGPGPTSGGVSYSNYYSKYDPTAIMPPEDTGLNVDDAPKRDKVEPVLENPLVQGARDVGKTSNQPVKIDVSAEDSFKPMGTKSSSSSNDGKFVGPRERRERMRAVRQAGRQRKRGMIKEARLTGGDVADARKQAKILKAQDIKAEAERMAGSNVDSYKTKFRGSGPKTPKSVKANNVSFANESAANSSAGAASRLSQNMKPVNINTKPKNAKTVEKLTDQDKYELARGGVGKKMAKSPIYKMNGFGSKTYK